MFKEKTLKVLDFILKIFNCFFGVFAYIYKGVWWFLKKVGLGIAKFFVTIGKFVNKVFKKGIVPFFRKIWEGITFVLRKIGQFFGFLSKSCKKGYNSYKQTKFHQTVFGPISRALARLSSKIKYHHRKAIWGVIFILPTMIGFVYFFLFPFITMIIFSFSNIYNTSVVEQTGEVFGVVTEWIGFDNYKYIWSVHSTFKETLGNVFLDTLLDVLLILIFSLIIAVVLNSKFKGRSFVRAIFFMPVIFNSQAVATAMAASETLTTALEEAGQDIFSTMFNFSDFLLMANLPNTAVNFLVEASASIFDVISYSGIQILIFLSGIQSVPKHLYEAAKIEGATQYEIFWKITFPMVSPLMLTAGVYTVVDSFIRSDLLSIMSRFQNGGNQIYTLGLGNLTYDGIYAAMSVLFFLVAIAVLAIVVLVLKPMVFYYDE